MNFEERLRHAFDEISERMREDVQRELHAAVPAIVRQLGDPASASRVPPVTSPSHTTDTVDRILASVRQIDEASSLSEVLEALLWAIARDSHRACLFLVRDDRLVVWRAKGFGDAVDAQLCTEPHQIALAQGGIAADACHSRDVVSSEGVDRVPAGLGTPEPFGRAASRAIRVGGQVVAVLYADRTADNTVEDARDGESGRAMAATLELLSRHASRCVETITAFRTAQLFTQAPGIETGRHFARWDVSLDGSDWAEDDAEAARRYARLLISEIKLYHEHAVIAGRRDRNLVSRLGGEIARARALYEQRVPRELDRRADYFDAEVVRTLANGDVSLLGATS